MSLGDSIANGNVIYTTGERRAVIGLIVAGVLSILGVASGGVYYFGFSRRAKTYHKTHIASYLICLLFANVLQAVATIMNGRWVHLGGVFNGGFCSFQGGLKNAANVGTALWTLVIAVHAFNLLFLRWKSTRASLIATIVGGWSFVFMIVTLGPSVIETSARGPYFGVSGAWCWITEEYRMEQTFMEYFFEFLSAGLCFVLYCLVLLRVRGNLITLEGRWKLRWIPRSEAWQLSFSRDMLDTAMLRVAACMIWFPVAYSLLLIPVALARFSAFTGHHVPFWATITTDFVFNITGLVNTALFVGTRRILPDTSSLPQFTTPRNASMSESETKFGVTPFNLEPRQSHESQEPLKEEPAPAYSAEVVEDLGEPVMPRQETHTLSEGVVVPTLRFSYPSRR